MQLAQVEWDSTNVTQHNNGYAYYNGGCAFRWSPDLNACQVLARYHDLVDKPAAVVECAVGKGKAILSGVHFEIGHHFFPFFSITRPNVYQQLKRNEPYQLASLNRILRHLDIKVTSELDIMSNQVSI